MSAEIIDFTTRHRTPGADDAPGRPVGLTTTAKNRRLRSARRDAWRKADATTNYWRALLDFTDAVSRAKDHDVKEAHAHAETSHEGRWSILDSWREALGRQLLTPAPDVSTVNWKRHQLSKTCIGTKKELVEKAIADDIIFFAAHPTRQNKGRVRS
jgi:hypothetical protein